MRGKAAFATTAFFLLLTPSFLPIPVFSKTPSSQSLIVEVNCTAWVYDGGCVFVNETVTLINEGGETLESFKVGFPQPFVEKLFYAVAYGLTGEEGLPLEREGLGRPGVYGLKVWLARPLLPGERTVIRLCLIFSNMVSFNDIYYELNVFLYPIFAVNVSRLDVTVMLPRDVSLSGYPEDLNVTTEGDWASLSLTKAPLEAFTERMATISFSGDFQAVTFEWAKRVVTVSGSAKITVSDTYELRNMVSKKLSTARLMLDKGAYNVAVEDLLGDLTFSASTGNETQYTNVTVTLRNELDKDMLATFTITYTLPTAPYLNYTLFGADYELRLGLLMGLKTTIKRVTVEVSLTEGATFIDAMPSNLSWNKTQELLHETLSWMGVNITPLHEHIFTLRYRYVLLWATFRPVLFTFLGVALLSTLLLASRRLRPVKPPPPIPIPLLKQFVEAYDEKVALRLELEKLTEEYRRGRVSRADFRKQGEVINRRRRGFESTISEAGPQLTKLGGRYKDMLNRVEEAEAEMEAVEASIRELMERYRTRRVSREVYEKLLSDYRRRLDRAKMTLDRIIITLRSETRA